MHHAPVAESDAAQAVRQGPGRQALQLGEGAAHFHVAFPDAEPGAARMPEALGRAEVRAQRRMERQLPDNILQPCQASLTCSSRGGIATRDGKLPHRERSSCSLASLSYLQLLWLCASGREIATPLKAFPQTPSKSTLP